MKTAAFFDLDDTILKGNSGMRTVLHDFFKGQVSFYHAFIIFYKYIFYFMGRSDPRTFFSDIYEFLKGRNYKTEQKRFADYFDQNIKRRIYKEAVKRIEWHKKQGHIVAIVTNSLDLMIGRIKDQLKVDHLIASSLVIRKGMITGKSAKISFGTNKVRYIKALAKKLNIDLRKSYAYSDNNTDIPLLKAVGNPIATNPKRKMRRTAEKNKWKILLFNETGV